MSIPLKYSPFTENDLPCKKCIEHENQFICSETQQECSNFKRCSNYDPYDTKEYRNNLSKSLKPMWVQREYDTYYVEQCSRCGERLPRNQWNRAYYSRYCPGCGKRLYSKDAEVTDVKPGVYQHFKGRQYEVIGVGTHTETSEKFVVYHALYGKYQFYIRPLTMFVEDVEDLKSKYRGPRFFKIDDED